MFDKIINELKGYLKGGQEGIQCGAIDNLLLKLNERVNKTEKRLEKEGNEAKRKHLKLELKIAKAELKRAERRRKELNKECI